MAGWLAQASQALASRRRQWRRARNLRAGAPARPQAMTAVRWIGVAGVLATIAGAGVIAAHARYLGAAAQAPLDAEHGAGMPPALDALQAAVLFLHRHMASA